MVQCDHPSSDSRVTSHLDFQLAETVSDSLGREPLGLLAGWGRFCSMAQALLGC